MKYLPNRFAQIAIIIILILVLISCCLKCICRSNNINKTITFNDIDDLPN